MQLYKITSTLFNLGVINFCIYKIFKNITNKKFMSYLIIYGFHGIIFLRILTTIYPPLEYQPCGNSNFV
jgi:hypothetical protein